MKEKMWELYVKANDKYMEPIYRKATTKVCKNGDIWFNPHIVKKEIQKRNGVILVAWVAAGVIGHILGKMKE